MANIVGGAAAGRKEIISKRSLFYKHYGPGYTVQECPKTVFFWAPVMKWGLVCAGMADMTRPAEKLSTAQSAVLMATGLIWSRYSLVIIPKNWGLFTVNFFVGCAGGSQLFRIWRYNQELKAKEKEQLQQKEP
ncbi:mitochondrial pyruvate carrier 2 isoform 2-T3 [Pangshura tecta]